MRQVFSSSYSQQVRSEIARLRTHRILRLRFGPLLEDRFEADTGAARAKRLSFEGHLLTAFFFVFAIVDVCTTLTPRAALVRWLIVLPWLAATSRFMRRNPPKFWRESSVVILAGVIASTCIVLNHDISAAFSIVAQIGLLLALLVTNVVMRLRFPFAVASTFFCLASDFSLLFFDHTLLHAEKLACAIQVSLVAIFLLVATYSLERDERLHYLLQMSNEIQAEELTALNIELDRRSSHDALTKLPNRAFFDRHFDLLWRQAARDHKPLSAIVVDIDHFKVVNDTQGHLYGDQVIQRVAALVRQSLRGKDDFAARYGGEEFVLLLPETTHESALLIAERVRSLVKIAGSPAPLEPMPTPGLFTTVSCGVATVLDAATFTPRQLLHAADTALYAAKADGRNCVRSAPLLGEPQPEPVAPKDDIEPLVTGWN